MNSISKRPRVLLGLFPETPAVDGSASFNDAVFNGLKEHCQVSFIVVAKPNRNGDSTAGGNGPLFSEVEFRGHPALRISPKSRLSFDLSKSKQTREAEETRNIATAIAAFAKKHEIDLVHVLQWLTLKSAFFEGALLSNRRVVHTPYDYWAVCPTYYLRYKNCSNECSGPDDVGTKCYRCMIQGRSNESQVVGGQGSKFRRALKNFLEPILCQKALLWLLSRRRTIDFGWRFQLQVEYMERLAATRRFYTKCDRILPMSKSWGKKLSTISGVDLGKFRVCSPGAFTAEEKLSKGDRFQRPIQIGHLHRTSQEGGTFFVLESWKTARIRVSDAQLVIYAQPGGEELIRRAGYGELIDNGSVLVKEGRIADKMAEALMPLAAIVTGYQWDIGMCGNATVTSYGIPTIASDWRFDGYERESFLRENSNCIFYKKWDVSSLMGKFQQLAANPTILEDIFDSFEMPAGFTHKDFIKRILSVYDDCLS